MKKIHKRESERRREKEKDKAAKKREHERQREREGGRRRHTQNYIDIRYEEKMLKPPSKMKKKSHNWRALMRIC